MVNQKSQSLAEVATYKYLVHMTGKTEAVNISESEYEGVLNALQRGDKFVKIRDYLLMLNSIVLIEPRNIPARPRPIQDYSEDGYYIKNQAELDEWDKLFATNCISLKTESK